LKSISKIEISFERHYLLLTINQICIHYECNPLNATNASKHSIGQPKNASFVASSEPRTSIYKIILYLKPHFFVLLYINPLYNSL